VSDDEASVSEYIPNPSDGDCNPDDDDDTTRPRRLSSSPPIRPPPPTHFTSPLPSRPQRDNGDEVKVRLDSNAHRKLDQVWSARELRIWEISNRPPQWRYMEHSDAKGPVQAAIDPPVIYPTEYKSSNNEPSVFAIKGIDPWYEHYSVLDWLFVFFPLSVLRRMVASTDKRGAAQAAKKKNRRGKTNKFKWTHPLTLNELVRWFSLFFLMGFMSLPRRRMYWSQEVVGAYVGPAYGKKSGISRHRWEAIMRVISYGPGPFAPKGSPSYLWDRVGDLVM
jgi:hypothetical protein